MDSELANWRKLRSGTDIRGTREQLTDSFAARLGYVFARQIAQRSGITTDKTCIAAGYDPGPYSRQLMDALIRGLRSADCDVLDCGQAAAPGVWLTCMDGRAHGALMVNSVPGRCEIRFTTCTGEVTSDDIDSMISESVKCELPDPLVREENTLTEYCARLNRVIRDQLQNNSVKPLLGVHVVINALCGSGAFFIRFLEDLGADVYGSLPKGTEGVYDIEDPETLNAMVRSVTQQRADLGIIISPDCARAAFIDRSGERIDRNRLIALAAMILLNEKPGRTFVTDSVTSSGLATFITEWGGIHYRYKRGCNEVINEARRLNTEGIDCPLAIETSGHAAFRDNNFIDDGIYLAVRLICETLKRKYNGETLISLIDELCEPVERVEVRLPVLGDDYRASAQEVIETVLSHTLDDAEWELAPDNREGVRISFNLEGGVRNAWFLLRLSVHDPVMALNSESAIPGGVHHILGLLYDLIRDCEVLDLTPLKKQL